MADLDIGTGSIADQNPASKIQPKKQEVEATAEEEDELEAMMAL